jgi:hypothetical protein
MSWYHGQSEQAFRFLTGKSRLSWTQATEAEMKAAAQKLEFEQAARIKQRLSRATFVTSEAFSQLGRLEDFAFVALQPGQGKPYLEPWVIHPSMDPPVRALEQIKKKELTAGVEKLFAECQRLAAVPIVPPIAGATVEQLGLVAHHLFKSADDPAIYMRFRDLLAAGPELLINAATAMFERKAPAKPLPENASDKVREAPPATVELVVASDPPSVP